VDQSSGSSGSSGLSFGFSESAWAVITLSGTTVTVRRSNNMSSVVRASQGIFTFTYTTGFTDSYYATYGSIQYGPLASPNENSDEYNGVFTIGRSTGNRTASLCRIAAQYTVDARAYDPVYVSAVFIRG